MTRPSRTEADRIHYQGFTYFPYMPPSEQYPALTVTRKFSRKPRIDPEDVDLTQRDMVGFVSVYPRLYQVPRTMQERIERWYHANKKLGDSWPLDGFWHSVEDDAHDEIIVREPGIPPEVKQLAGIEDEPKHKAPKEKKPKPPKQPKTSAQPSTSNASKPTPFPASVILRCQELEHWSQEEYFAAELKAAERSFSYIHGWVEDALKTGRSPSKAQLDELLGFASSALTRSKEAVKISSAVVEDLGSTPAALVHPAFLAWQQQQEQQQQEQTMGQEEAERRKRPLEMTDQSGLEEGEPSGASKARKLSSYRSAPESRSGNSTPLSHRGYNETGSSLTGSRAVSGSAPIHPAFLQQFGNQQPDPTNHVHDIFRLSSIHGPAAGFLPMEDVNENRAGKGDEDSEGRDDSEDNNNDDGEEDEDDEDDEEGEDEDDDDGEDDGGNSDDDASD